MNPFLLDIIKPLEDDSFYEIVVIDGDKNFIKNGYLLSMPSQRRIIIKNDIPDFENIEINKHPQKEVYNFWWNESHKFYEYNEDKSKNIFSKTIKIKEKDFNESKVLDLGCGNGRFSNIISKYNPSLLVLFDISDGIFTAYENAKRNCKNVIAIKGNILNIPLKKNYFDIVYSWGVLHHTGNTRLSFTNASNLVKESGKLGIYVYESHPKYSYQNIMTRLLAIIRQILIINVLRYICIFLSGKFVTYLFQPIYYFEKLTNMGIVGCHGSGKEKFNKKDYFRRVIDRFKTRYATEHSLEEVINWFFEENFNELIIGEEFDISITGTKDSIKISKKLVLKNYK